MEVRARTHTRVCQIFRNLYIYYCDCIKGNSSQYKGVKKKEKRTWILETNASWCEQNVYQTPVIPQTSTYLLLPSHHLDSSIFSARPHIIVAGGALLLLLGKRRQGQAFAYPLPPAIISLICTPSQPWLLWLPPPFLPLTYSNWSRVEWVSRDEGGTHARRWTSDPSTQWTCLCRLGSSSDIQLCFSLDNKTPRLCPGPEERGNKTEETYSS